ncbi:MAG: HEPN domain-containing protein [Terriglobia bacterium]
MSAARSNYRTWLAKAEHDLLNIENNLQAPAIPWDTVCFHAQQAAEKFLKAFLVSHGQPPILTHDLVALLAACVPLNPSLATRQQDCQKLSYYAVAVRYPSDLYEPTETDARQMIEAAHRIRADVLACLP